MKNVKNLKVLLAEDKIQLIRAYSFSLDNSGFQVFQVKHGSDILKILDTEKKNFFDAVVSDTDMDYESDGPDSIHLALQEGLIDRTKTLIVGMSSIRSCEDYWKGIAHAYCFYVKDCISDLGFRVKTDLDNFRKDQFGLYRREL